jgi:hypothetical protein
VAQHPYGMQRLIRQWGKDLVVNVSQRTSLYRAHAVAKAEYTWLQEVVAGFRSGALTWSRDDFSEGDGAQP